MLRRVSAGGGTPAKELPPAHAAAATVRTPAALVRPEKVADPGSDAALAVAMGGGAVMPPRPHPGGVCALPAPPPLAAAAALLRGSA